MATTNVPALVLEGGGYRGIFTAGVLDVLMEHGVFSPRFSSVWGVSAGALNAVSFRSRQIGRTMRIMLAFRDDPRMVSLVSLVKTGDLAGADFMYDEVQNRLDPCDLATFNAETTPTYFVASDVTFGTAAYLPVFAAPEDIVKARASASMPLVSHMVEIDGHHYLDGGTTDSIPFGAAMELEGAPEVPGRAPAERALVVITQDRGYVKSGASEQMVVRSHRYDAYPLYTAALESRAERYNAQREQLWGLEREGRCLVLGPRKPVEVSVNESDGGPLLALYLEGRQEAASRLDEILAFL